MPIHVKYFASLRERMGRAEDVVDALDVDTVADVWAHVSEGLDLPGNVLVAVNMEYADPDHPVKDGDEVAFFPPITGG
ncbi:MAG: molybdopterin converting factor subunit 1 [Gammaproteobacteria bacterium]